LQLPMRRGRVAQLGERLVRNEEAEGSNPFSSTKLINNLDCLSELHELPNFGPWQLKTDNDLLRPHQTEIAVPSQFHVTLAYVLGCVSRPKVFQRFRTIGLFDMRKPEAPEDVEASAVVRHVVEDRVQAVAERVRLQKLCASQRVEQEPGALAVDVRPQHLGDRPAKVHFPYPILCFQIGLNFSPLCLLHDIERAEVLGDVFIDFEAERFTGAQRAATSEKRVEHPILVAGKEQMSLIPAQVVEG
jgi:hypothetical protein